MDDTRYHSLLSSIDVSDRYVVLLQTQKCFCIHRWLAILIIKTLACLSYLTIWPHAAWNTITSITLPPLSTLVHKQIATCNLHMRSLWIHIKSMWITLLHLNNYHHITSDIWSYIAFSYPPKSSKVVFTQ